MTAGRLILDAANPALDANGEVDAGATLTFYENGTTTLQSIYSDVALTTPLANPLSCDAAGRFPQIYADSTKIFSVKWSPTGESPITLNNITPVGALVASGSFNASFSGPFNSDQAVSIGYTRIGNLVTLSFPHLAAAAAGTNSGTAAAAIGTVPASLLPYDASSSFGVDPTSAFWGAAGVAVSNSSLNVTNPLDVGIDNVGAIQIKNVQPWGTSANNGWAPFNVTYRISP